MVAHHGAVLPADIGAAAPARVEVLMQAELWMMSTALQAPGCRDCLGPLFEAGRDGPLSCRRYVVLEELWCQAKEL